MLVQALPFEPPSNGLNFPVELADEGEGDACLSEPFVAQIEFGGLWDKEGDGQDTYRCEDTCKDLNALPFDGYDPEVQSYIDGHQAIIHLNYGTYHRLFVLRDELHQVEEAD